MIFTATENLRRAAGGILLGALALGAGCGWTPTVEEHEDPQLAMAGVRDADLQKMSRRDLAKYHDTRRTRFALGSTEEYVNGRVTFSEVIDHKVYKNLRVYRGGVLVRFKDAKFRSIFVDFDDADLTCNVARVRFRDTPRGRVIDEVAARGNVVFSSDRDYLITRRKLEVDFENTAFHSGGVVFIPFHEDPDRKTRREDATPENAPKEGEERTVIFDRKY